MARVPEEFIELVRASVDIAEVIGEHLPLVATGRNFKALCPFHDEKTPSFVVSPDRQTYHCFGCGAGGNVLGFLMKHEGLEFRQALEHLASRAGMALPADAPSAPGRAGAPGPGRLLAALEAAARLYEHNLWELAAGERARTYLAARGLSVATARAARLGYALPGFDHARLKLGPAHGLATLVEAGILVDRGSDRTYDRFRDRVVFPILDPSGRPIGFGARSLDGSEPKYLNSPETPVYRKREVLYGLEAARSLWAREGTAWVVEGYMDVLALREAGLGGAVAVSGTALTERHARLLKRHAARVVLLFDGDQAGRGAVVRSLAPLLGAGLGVRAALLPAGEDPDSLVKGEGVAAIRELVDRATGVVDFLVSHFRQIHSKEEARAVALSELATLGAVVPDGLGRRLLAEEAARRLGFDETTLAREIELKRSQPGRLLKAAGRGPVWPAGAPRASRVEGTAAASGSAAGGGRSGGPVVERTLLALALGRPRVVARMREALTPGDFTDPALGALAERLLARGAGGESVEPAALAGPESPPELAGLVTELAVERAAGEGVEEETAWELVEALVARRRRGELQRLRELIREHEAAGRLNEIPPLLERVRTLVDPERPNHAKDE